MGEHVYVSVQVGGQRWTAFTRIAVTYSAKHASRAFQFTATDNTLSLGDAWNFFPGTPVQVFANADQLLDGYIDRMAPTFDATNHQVEVSGRSKTADAVDSSAEHETGEMKDKTVTQICQELSKKFDFRVMSRLADQEKVEYFRINPGESAFDAMNRVCQKKGVRIMDDEQGNLLLVNKPQYTNAPLIEGVNILAGTADFNDSDAHSEYKFKGNRAFHTKRNAYTIEATEKNSRIKRNRPKVLRDYTDTTEEEAKKRAKYHKDTKNGESVTANFRTQGWHDSAGAPWKANSLIPVYCPTLKLVRTMGISSVQLTQDQSGSTTQLNLVLPSALGGDKGSGGKSSGGSPWNEDD